MSDEVFRWVVVVAPRGDVVRLTARYSKFNEAMSLFGLVLEGYLDQGTPVTVQGSHVALAWREAPVAWRPAA